MRDYTAICITIKDIMKQVFKLYSALYTSKKKHTQQYIIYYGLNNRKSSLFFMSPSHRLKCIPLQAIPVSPTIF